MLAEWNWMLAKMKIEQKEQFLLLNIFLLGQYASSSYFDISVSNIPLKSALSLVLSLETSCSSATCFLIELTSTYLPHQMAPFPCLCLARIYKHISTCPDWDMDGLIQGLGPCVSISRRDLNSLNELGRSVPLYYFAFSSYLHDDFSPIQILCSRSCVSLNCLQNSSHIFQDPFNKAISANWKDFFNLSAIFDLAVLCNLITNPNTTMTMTLTPECFLGAARITGLGRGSGWKR